MPSSETKAVEQLAEEIALEKEPASESGLGKDGADSSSSQIKGSVALSEDASRASIGFIERDGLTYEVQPDGATVSVTGSDAAAVRGDIVVPATVSSGSDSYAVTGVDEGAFADRVELTSLSLPASIERIAQDAFDGCTALASLYASKKNERFASFDGMLFSKDLASLLFVPEGKKGVARIPDETTAIPSLARCAGLAAVEAGEGNAALSSRDGVLYSKDAKTLVACPPSAGKAVVVPQGVEAIAAGAFAGCAVASIAVLGDVRDIAADAFDDAAKANAVVALPGGEGYDKRRAVWEDAGFSRFAEPAKPGDVSEPAAPEGEGEAADGTDAPQASGLAFQLLDDYTLAVSWRGPEGPSGHLDIPAIAEVGGVSYRVSAIASEGFAGLAGLTGVTLPSSLLKVGERAFEATGFSELWLPASVESVGLRAFAACPSLARVVALGAPETSPDTLAECSGVSVYCPSGSEPSWNPGLPAAGNHVLPYGVALADEPLQLEVGQSTSILEGGSLEAPEPVEVAYSYAAKPLSVDPDGTTTGKAEGSSEVSVALTLGNVELARATRAVEVAPAPAQEPEAEASVPEAGQAQEPDGRAEPAPASLDLEPRLSATGVEVLSGTVLLADEVRIFDYEYEGSNLRYQVLSEPSGSTPGTCSVLGRSYSVANLEGHLIIPEKAVDASNGNAAYTVTTVVSYAFRGMNISSASLPQTITSLNQGSFRDCPYLTSFTVPRSVKTMGFNPFLNCPVLTDLSVEEGSNYFSSLDGVIYDKNKTLLIGGTPATVTGYFTIPETVVRVRVNAFYACDSMTGIFVPKSVTNFGDGYNIIGALKNLKDIDIDPENRVYAVEDGLLYQKANGVPATLIGCTLASISEVPVIPSTVTRIGKSSFTKNPNVRSTVVPPLVTYVGSYMFKSCQSFTHAAFLCDQPVTFDSYVFAECPNLKEVLAVSGSPSFPNTEGSVTHVLFNLTDTRNVTVHCPASAQDAWAAFGVNAVPFATNVPTTIGVAGTEAVVQQFNPSIPSDSAFAEHVKLVHTFDAKTSGIAADQSDPTGRTVTFSGGSGSGPATLTSKLVYDDGWYGEVVLAESTSEVVAAARSGALPTTADAGNKDESKASWSLSPEGVLTVKGTEKIADFGWTDGGANGLSEHWGPLRDSVTAVDTRSIQGGATSMALWFADMPRLSNIDDLAIPDGVENVSRLLSGCNLEALPDGFALPRSVKNVDALLASNPLRALPSAFAASFAQGDGIVSCRSMLERTAIEHLPEGFALPTNLEDASRLFSGSKLAELPVGFEIPSSVAVVDGMFQGCMNIVELPEGFNLKEGVESAESMFEGCASLVNLSEAFSLPSTLNAAKAAKMFGNCGKLLVLPAGFTLPEGFDLAAVPDLFYCHKVSRLYYAGSDTRLLGAAESYWTDQMRQFTPDGEGSVRLKLSKPDGTGFETWTSLLPDMASGAVTDFTAPARDGKAFALWYADEACTRLYDFSKRVADQLAIGADGTYTLYGLYVDGMDGVDGGFLPTEGNWQNASWSLAADGTLYLWGNGSVDDLGWDWNSESLRTTHWGPLRDRVTRVVMDPCFNAKRMRSWFMNMPGLTDASGAFVPEGTEDASRLFGGDASLKGLPDGFAIPEGVTNVMAMFENCTSLVSLPAGFSVPDSVTNLSGIFIGCTSLASLPEGFKLSKTADWFVDGIFENCSSLTTLPAGFSFPNAIYAKPEHGVFRCELAEDGSRVPMHYSGDDPLLLNYDWESQNRTLVTDSADMGEWGMRQVTFKLQSADEAAGFPWETRMTVWTDKQGVLGEPAAPQLNGYVFSGWCVDEECFEPFDFSQPVPEGVETLYGTWVVAGAKNGIDRSGGELPCVDAAGNPVDSTVWWRIIADGTLQIEGEGIVGELGLNWDAATSHQGYWEPFRNQVSRIHMGRGVGAKTMSAWFCRMGNLVDVSGAFVPEGCKNVGVMFYSCGRLKTLPGGFALPKSVEEAGGFLQGCSNLVQLPDSFLLPTDIQNVQGMFRSCSSLATLPAGFTIPDGARFASRMFSGCYSLKSLPEGFSIPSTMEFMDFMFSGCNALTTLPASFDFPLTVAEKAIEPFMCTDTTGTLETYFAGGAASQSSVNKYKNWAGQKRTIIADVPAGKVLVELGLPAKGTEADGHATWARVLVNAASTFSAPAAPKREGLSFVGWFSDILCTTAYDFSKSPANNGAADGGTLNLYARYAATSGPLPTVDGLDRASWKIESDGTLNIICEEGAVIADLGWTEGTYRTGYWGPLRSEVTSIDVTGVQVDKSMAYWFAFCPNLKNVPDSFAIGEGVADVSSLFDNCASLERLPSGFTLPSTVTAAAHLLRSCTKLVTLPANFALPAGLRDGAEVFSNCTSLESVPAGVLLYEGVGDVHSLFYQCYRLKSLPSGFTIPKSATLVRNMFFECRALESLPLGFTIPDDCASTEYRGMFYGCQSLKSLPEGFALPSSGRNFNSMFWRCNSLTWLPASFDLSRLSPEATLEGAFTYSVVGGGTTTTFYAGSDPSKLLPPGASGDAVSYWESTYKRVLLWDGGGSGALPGNVHKVTFKLQRPGEATSVGWMTALTTIGGDGNAYASKPPDPYEFGYAFSGWKDAATGEPFAFDKPVAADVELVGSYALVMSFMAPVSAKVTVDSSGFATDAPLRFSSNTPVPLRLSSVSGSPSPGAAKLFPNASELEGVEIRIGLGRMSFGLFPASADAGNSASALVGQVPAATPAGPGALDGTLAIDRHGAQIDYQPGDDITSFAKLAWTVEAVS